MFTSTDIISHYLSELPSRSSNHSFFLCFGSMMNTYQGARITSPLADRYANVPFYGWDLPSEDDFHVDT